MMGQLSPALSQPASQALRPVLWVLLECIVSMQAVWGNFKSLSPLPIDAEQCAALLRQSLEVATQRKLFGCLSACWVVSIAKLQPTPWPLLNTYWGALTVHSPPLSTTHPRQSTGCMGSMAGPSSQLAGWR